MIADNSKVEDVEDITVGNPNVKHSTMHNIMSDYLNQRFIKTRYMLYSKELPGIKE